ncbi:uncharacterized protein BX664DRAFT_342052 [Halteromyces radiatus]|uniref:uncharacterized protein n=1 Tax=Halteromyces radiatus TaxID=101107 RepID=UPI00221F6FF4|nr:uncharacterized protein BX664DRAFT_342052 [Halteromyces radiatus]KAI8080006.1 hypothetical protein BX664DRAFT_342052 [Halteromyces radiatus]
MTLATFKNTGRGMMATSDIAAGEVIVRVPKSFLISNDALYKIYGPHSLSTHQLLALHLVLLLQDSNCWWKPYLDLLPSHFNTLPVTFPPTLSSHLPDGLKNEVELQRQKIKSDYLAAVQFLKTKKTLMEPSSLSSKQYEWAWLCVNTRCIHVTTSDNTAKGGNIAMAPLLDFLNHTSEARIESGFNPQTQSFEIKTLIPYRKGEQVFINYGPHDNQAIFREYGFVLPQNEYNFVSLDKEVWSLFEDIEPSEKARSTKRWILKNSGYEGDYTVKTGDISFRLLCALRLLAIKGSEGGTFQRSVMAWQDVIMGQSDQIDDTNERTMYHMLKSICTNALAHSENKRSGLNNLAKSSIHHPFALLFLRQIWNESCDILQDTLHDIDTRLTTL